MQDLIYNWNPKRKVVINPDMKMSQFDLIATPISNQTNSLRRGKVYDMQYKKSLSLHTESTNSDSFHFKLFTA